MRFAYLSLAVLALIAAVYQPVMYADFVWVDKICFRNAAWLRYGDGWKELVFHDFYDWVNYFRPLVVALFVAEVRGFDATPGPMHLVSLLLHLLSTLLVGILALRLTKNIGPPRRSMFLSVAAMLLYGLHAALIEPVVWVSCQYELVVTLFMMLGLTLNAVIPRESLRALGVSTCFFLAACAKESAVAFPLLLLLVDWMQLGSASGVENCWGIRSVWRRQRTTYIAVFLGGVAYLALRLWGLGFLVQSAGTEPLFTWARLQTVSFVFLTYWRILVWPMVGLGPLHIVDQRQFATFSPSLLSIDLAAIAIPILGLYLAVKRKPLGILILAITMALLPVLHVIPVDFDMSLYHERYAMTAAAIACALLPRVLTEIAFLQSRLWTMVACAFASIWLAVSVVNIRATLPLWSDEVKLWSWALRQHPGLAVAESHLLAAYGDAHQLESARQVADLLINQSANCSDCMLNVAALAVEDGDLPRLKAALKNIERTLRPPFNPRELQAYVIATGQMHELQGDLQEAIYAYQDAIRLEPLDPMARLDLALLEARQGLPDARKNMEIALSLFTPDQRRRHRAEFEKVVAKSAEPAPASSSPPPRH